MFVTMWNTKIGVLPGYQPWDGSAAVRNMLLRNESGRTDIPTNKSIDDWDCPALFKATIHAQTFALPDSKGHKRTLAELFLMKKKRMPGSIHPSVNSTSGDKDEMLALAIDQLRLLRNAMCHFPDMRLDKATFDHYVQLTKDAFASADVDTSSIDAICSLTEADFPRNRVTELKECIHKELKAGNTFLQQDVIDEVRKIRFLTQKYIF